MRDMTTPTTPQEAIESAALGPKSISVDGQIVTEHSLPDLIAADRHLAQKASQAASPRGFGIRIQKLVPPGGG